MLAQSHELNQIDTVIALSAAPYFEKADLSQFLSINTNWQHNYLALCRDSPLVDQAHLLPCQPVLVNRDNLQVMDKYINKSDIQLANLLSIRQRECYQLALFVSGHSSHLGQFNQSQNEQITSYSIKLKTRRFQATQCQIFLCQREPCLQNVSRKQLMAKLRQFTHSVNRQANWCQVGLTDCLGGCTPGGRAIIYQHFSLMLPPVNLRFMEHLTLAQWQCIIEALNLRRPISSVIPSSFIIGNA